VTAAGGRQATLAPVAVDAMGGDRAPGEIVAGARQAAKELPRPVVLVGRPEAIEAVDGGAGGLEVIPAGEVIAMDEDPAQGVRRKKDSSLVRAAEAVRDGRAAAMVSAGNTGATMASALLRMGRLPGVARPAIATPIPVPGSTPTVLLDAGANAECAPAWMVQFAQMGSAFARERFGEKPLFLHEHAGELMFASELTTLVEIKPQLRELDVRAIDAFFVFAYVPGPGTIVPGGARACSSTLRSIRYCQIAS